jgi:hypothetical protein
LDVDRLNSWENERQKSYCAIFVFPIIFQFDQHPEIVISSKLFKDIWEYIKNIQSRSRYFFTAQDAKLLLQISGLK